MPTYVVSDVRFLDQEAVDAYRTRVAASIAHFGGHYLARGETIERLEGRWDPKSSSLSSSLTWRGLGTSHRNMQRRSNCAIRRSAEV
jgi:hypothetical protein